MRVTIVQDRPPKPRHPLSHQLQKHEVEVRREKEMPEAEAILGSSIDSRVNTSWKVFVLITLWVLASSQMSILWNEIGM